VPALSPYIIDPIWEQFSALLPERDVDHPLGCHNPRIPDRVVFEKLEFRSWSSAAPTRGSPTGNARRPPSGVGAMSGSTPW
jgi:hypothetical protein